MCGNGTNSPLKKGNQIDSSQYSQVLGTAMIVIKSFSKETIYSKT
jgi:hypothetical protein